ncbi:hypothetical protein BH23ACT11_BH23ACT11_11810 [soil metagenome]
MIVALAVAAVVLIFGGEGNDKQSAAVSEPSEKAPQTAQSSTPEKPAPKTDSREKSENSPDAGEEQASRGADKLGTPALGDEGAPVVMTEFSDYQ